MGVKITIDTNAVRMKLEAASKKALAVTSKQALADCNEFCPEDQGVLINSSISHSRYTDGLLVWVTPYARYLYYGLLMVDSVTHSAWARKGTNKMLTDKELIYHPKHSSSTPGKLWCEKARETYSEDWRQIYQNALRRNLK